MTVLRGNGGRVDGKYAATAPGPHEVSSDVAPQV